MVVLAIMVVSFLLMIVMEVMLQVMVVMKIMVAAVVVGSCGGVGSVGGGSGGLGVGWCLCVVVWWCWLLGVGCWAGVTCFTPKAQNYDW